MINRVDWGEKQHMKATLLAFMMIFMAQGIAFASECETPSKTAKAYVQYDLEGARLGGDGGSAANINKLVIQNRIEPGWDIANLVTGYEIKSIKQKGKKAVVTILFKNSWETTTFKADAVKDEIVEMHLIQEEKGCWRVGPPFYRPHLYSESLERHLEKLIKSQAKEAGKEWLEFTQSELDSVREYSRLMR